MIDYITLVGFVLTIFVTGFSVGKFVEKVERFIDRHDDGNHKRKKHKTTAISPEKIRRSFLVIL